MGERIRDVAHTVAYLLSPGSHNRGLLTLVHGDFKGGNIFFRREGPGCAVIDFQWTGPGIAATDLVYLFASALDDESIERWEDLLKQHHSTMSLALSGSSDELYTYESLREHFRLAILD